MRYTMTQFLDRLGVSRETLRHYERLGLIAPDRYANNYRRYDDLDGLEVLRVKFMQHCELSLEEVKAGFDTLGALDQRLDEAEKGMLAQIEALQMRVMRVRKYRSFVGDAAAARDGEVCELDTYGIHKLMLFGEGVTADAETRRIAAQWIETLPAPDIGWRIPLPALMKDENAPVDTQIGLMALTRFAEEYALTVTPPVEFFPSGRSIRMMLAIRDPFHVSRAQLAPLFDYAAAHGQTIISDISGRFSGCDRDAEGRLRYHFSARALIR